MLSVDISLLCIVILFSLSPILSTRDTHGDVRYSRLRSALNNFTSYSYDEIHTLAILDQVEAYIKPINSIETRDSKSLDGLYDFCFDPDARGFAASFFQKSLVESCPKHDYYRMPVPSAFNDILSNKTAKNYVGWMWYQTSVFWPSQISTPNQHQTADQSHLSVSDWMLQIESINYLAIVWMQIIDDNDANKEAHLVGSHVGGHLPITLNVSSILNQVSKTGSQLRLTIAVNNLLTANTIPSGQLANMTHYVGRPYYKFEPDFDFFNYAGIMGDVRLIRLAKHFIEDAEVLPNDEHSGNSNILMKVCLNAPLRSEHSIVLSMTSFSNSVFTCGGHNEISDDCSPTDRCKYLTICSELLTCKRFGDLDWPRSRSKGPPIKVRLSLRLGTLKPGSFEPDDDVYELSLVRRTKPAELISKVSGGQLQGFGMHHEQLFSGRTMSLSSIMKDLYLLKQMGANVIRTSHYPYSRAYLDACDELGLMVIAECPAVGLQTFNEVKLMLHKQILLEMTQRDHGHPSIIMWSLANEPQSELPEARAYFSSLVQYARNDLARFTIETGRPLTVAIAQSHRDDKIGDLFDVLMINRYYGWYECTGLIECVRHSLVESLNGWSNKYGKNKPLILSEFGADTLAGIHSGTGDIFSEEFQRDLIVEYERVIDELVASSELNFLGAMIWNFADFSTHESLMRVGGNRKGVFTRSREPKLVASSVKQIYQSRLSSSTE